MLVNRWDISAGVFILGGLLHASGKANVGWWKWIFTWLVFHAALKQLFDTISLFKYVNAFIFVSFWLMFYLSVSVIQGNEVVSSQTSDPFCMFCSGMATVSPLFSLVCQSKIWIFIINFFVYFDKLLPFTPEEYGRTALPASVLSKASCGNHQLEKWENSLSKIQQQQRQCEQMDFPSTVIAAIEGTSSPHWRAESTAQGALMGKHSCFTTCRSDCAFFLIIQSLFHGLGPWIKIPLFVIISTN